MRLTRQQSMTRAFQFARVRNEGPSVAGRLIVLSATPLEHPEEPSKFGIICTKKIGCAVVRNKLRRRVREILRAHGAPFENGVHLVCVLAGGPWKPATPTWNGTGGKPPENSNCNFFPGNKTRHDEMAAHHPCKGIPNLHQRSPACPGGPRKRLPLYTHLFPVLHPGRSHPRSLARLSSWHMAYFKMQPVGRIRL